MTVKDNGTGVLEITRRMNSGMGLQIMDYRASLINAVLDVKRGPLGGTVVTCVLSDTYDELSEKGTLSIK